MQIKESLLKEFIKQSLINEMTQEDWKGPIGQKFRDIIKQGRDVDKNPHKIDHRDEIFKTKSKGMGFNKSSGTKVQKVKDLKSWWNEYADHDFFNNTEDLKSRKEKVVVVHSLAAYAHQKNFKDLNEFIKEKEKIYKDLKNKLQKNEISALGFLNHDNKDSYEICKSKIGKEAGAGTLNIMFYLNPRRITHASKNDSGTDIFSDYPTGNKDHKENKTREIKKEFDDFEQYLINKREDSDFYYYIYNNPKYKLLYDAIHYPTLRISIDDIKNYFKNNTLDVDIIFNENIKSSPTFEKDKNILKKLCEYTIKYLCFLITDNEFKSILEQYIKVPSFLYYIGKELNNKNYLDLVKKDLEDIESYEYYEQIKESIFKNVENISRFFKDRDGNNNKKLWFNFVKYFQDIIKSYFNENKEKLAKSLFMDETDFNIKFYPNYCEKFLLQNEKGVLIDPVKDYEEIKDKMLQLIFGFNITRIECINKDKIVKDKEKMKKIISLLKHEREVPNYFEVTKNSGTRKSPSNWNATNADYDSHRYLNFNVLSEKEVEGDSYLGELIVGNWKPDSVWFSLMNVQRLKEEMQKADCKSFKDYIRTFEKFKKIIEHKDKDIEEVEKDKIKKLFDDFDINDVDNYLLQLYNLYFFSMQGITCFDKEQNKFKFSSSDFGIVTNELKNSIKELIIKRKQSKITSNDFANKLNGLFANTKHSHEYQKEIIANIAKSIKDSEIYSNLNDLINSNILKLNAEYQGKKKDEEYNKRLKDIENLKNNYKFENILRNKIKKILLENLK